MIAFHWSQREQFGVAAPHDACVVEHQVESAGAGDHIVDRRLHRRGVGDVEPGERGASAERRRGALGGVSVDVGADHVGARAGQRPAQGGADPEPAPVTIACLPANAVVSLLARLLASGPSELRQGSSLRLRQFHHMPKTSG